MFEALQMLQRISEHFGEGCVVSIGIYQNMACVSVSWGDRAMCNYDIPVNSVYSTVPNDVLEQMVIQHIENAYKIWEVGEI